MDAHTCLEEPSVAARGSDQGQTDIRGPVAAKTARRIELRAPVPVRAYVGRLVDRLTRAGHSVRVRNGRTGVPGAIDWLLYFEGLAYRTRSLAFAPDPRPFAAGFDGDPDFVIDLAGDAPVGPTPTLRVLFDGVAGEAGLVDALLTGAAPHVRVVRDSALREPILVANARIAVERPDTLAASLDTTTARLATLLSGALESVLSATGIHSDIELTAPAPASPLAFGAHALRGKLMARLTDVIRRADHWRIVVRTVDGDGVMERLDWSGAPWRALPDDGGRYYADPFLFGWQGRRWLFCEEYPYATGRGILSVAEIADDGRVGRPQPVLDSGTHLSWPQVFAHDGVVYMIPESSAAGRIELWRAIDFPFRWDLDRVLLEGVRAHDPQLLLTDRAAFLLATLDEDGGSSWDALGLFHAPGLLGPWAAHPGNPLLIDARCARGAGPFVRRGGELWRAAQDCSGGYGAKLALCRITRLDEGGFGQDVVARLGPPPGLSAQGVHTLARLGSLEAVDVRGPRRKVRAG